MAIRPVDVRRKEFKSGFRGYDANQVDDFLDEVADEFERTYAENRRMSDELSTLRGRLEQFEELEGAIREALVEAQQAARDLRRNANKEAELVVREAKEQAHRILADSSARVERVQESYEVLRKAKQDFNNDFRHLLRTYADVMERADATSAKEIEASLRSRLDTESIAAARQAAETQRIDASELPDQAAGEPEADEETGSMEPVPSAPQTETADDATRRLEKGPSAQAAGPEPDSEETQPSGAQTAPEPDGDDQATQRRDAPFAPASEPGAAGEVDREEPMPAGGDRASDDFFDKERQQRPEDEGEGRIFRASRFLRRRG